MRCTGGAGGKGRPELESSDFSKAGLRIQTFPMTCDMEHALRTLARIDKVVQLRGAFQFAAENNVMICIPTSILESQAYPKIISTASRKIRTFVMSP